MPRYQVSTIYAFTGDLEANSEQEATDKCQALCDAYIHDPESLQKTSKYGTQINVRSLAKPMRSESDLYEPDLSKITLKRIASTKKANP